MQTEILAGAVAELHEQERRDLAAERAEAIRLLQRSLEIREAGPNGPHKTDVRTFLARAGELPPQYRSITRIDRLKLVANELVALAPEADDALNLLQAWYRGVEERFGDARCQDLKARCNEVEEALADLDRVAYSDALAKTRQR